MTDLETFCIPLANTLDLELYERWGKFLPRSELVVKFPHLSTQTYVYLILAWLEKELGNTTKSQELITKSLSEGDVPRDDIVSTTVRDLYLEKIGEEFFFSPPELPLYDQYKVAQFTEGSFILDPEGLTSSQDLFRKTPKREGSRSYVEQSKFPVTYLSKMGDIQNRLQLDYESYLETGYCCPEGVIECCKYLEYYQDIGDAYFRETIRPFLRNIDLCKCSEIEQSLTKLEDVIVLSLPTIKDTRSICSHANVFFLTRVELLAMLERRKYRG